MSAFVFPGAGHFFLKRYPTGILLFLAGLLVLGFIFLPLMEMAEEIAKKIAVGEVPLDWRVINRLVTQRLLDIISSAYLPLWSLAGIWLLGMWDAYRLGRADERRSQDGHG
jgi:hypothetical protein